MDGRASTFGSKGASHSVVAAIASASKDKFNYSIWPTTSCSPPRTTSLARPTAWKTRGLISVCLNRSLFLFTTRKQGTHLQNVRCVCRNSKMTREGDYYPSVAIDFTMTASTFGSNLTLIALSAGPLFNSIS